MNFITDPNYLPFILVWSAIFAALIGSFLSVCIFRIPYGRVDEYGEEELPEGSVQHQQKAENVPQKTYGINSPPRSFCPKCEKQLYWWHNIPIISWLILGGKCYFCKQPIPARYPIVELLSVLSAVICISQFGPTPTAVLMYIFLCSLIVMSFIDIDYYIIPDSISIGGTVVGLAIGTVNQFYHIFKYPVSDSFVVSILGVLTGGGILFAVAELYLKLRKIEGLGMGDVKLLAFIGAMFGAECAFYTIFLGSFIGSIIGGVMMLVKGKNLTYQIPFGPYLALGSVIYLFCQPLVQWLMGFLTI